MKNKVSNIDLVITWVDGTDPKWLADCAKYAPKGEKIDDGELAGNLTDTGIVIINTFTNEYSRNSEYEK